MTGHRSSSPRLANAGSTAARSPARARSARSVRHPHPLDVHRRLLQDGKGRDTLVLAADIDARSKKICREPTPAEIDAASKATHLLADEAPFGPLTPAVPDERIAPGNNNIIGPSIYGARTYGDFMVDRQTLSYVRLAKIIAGLADELRAAGLSDRYVRALAGYATAVVAKKLRRSTRGARFQSRGAAQVGDLFVNEGSITFSHDFFEAGIGEGPGTWNSIADNVLTACRNLFADLRGCPTGV